MLKWVLSHAPQVKKENPSATFGDIGKLLGQKWKEINDSDKAKFDEMAKKDKVRLFATPCKGCSSVIACCPVCTSPA